MIKMSLNNYISVVIPTKNRHDKILSAVKSAAAIDDVSQVIVVDDGSFPEIKRGLFSQLGVEKKLTILKNAYVAGAQGARLTGALSSENEIVLFLDSDDILLESGVNRLYRAIVDDPSLIMVYSDVIGAGTKSSFLRIEGDGFRDVLKNLSLCPFSGMMVRKSLMPWDSLDLRLPAWQDDDFCLVACKKGRVKYLDEPAVRMTASSDSISRSRFRQVIGLAILIDKWKHEILSEFGPGRLLLWRLRLLSGLLYAISDEIQSLRNSGHLNPVISVSGYYTFRIPAKAVNIILRRYFDRVYA